MKKFKFFSSNGIKTGKKKYANPVFPEWSEKVVEELAKNLVQKAVFKYSALLLFVPVVIVVFSIALGFYTRNLESRAEAVISQANGILNEYGNILGDIKIYEEYASERISPPVYLQYAVLGTVASKLGFFFDKVSFERTKDIGQLKESFAVETTKSPDAVNVIGIWTITGSLPKETDNKWIISLRETLDGTFSLYGVRAYTSASVQGNKVNATVVVWREGR